MDWVAASDADDDDDDDGGLIKGLTGNSLSVYLFSQSPNWNASVSRSTRSSVVLFGADGQRRPTARAAPTRAPWT